MLAIIVEVQDASCPALPICQLKKRSSLAGPDSPVRFKPDNCDTDDCKESEL